MIEEYIKSRQGIYIHNTIPIIIQGIVEKEVNYKTIAKEITTLIPKELMSNIDIVYIGDFQPLNDRQVDSAYLDGAIFLKRQQYSNDDVIRDIVHETAHSIEEMKTEEIYGDKKIKQEFLEKRFKLLSHYVEQNPELKKQAAPLMNLFAETDFSQKMDDVLYSQIGYEALINYTSGLFITPYSVTSMREYFATGFSYWFLESKEYVQKICPKLFDKLNNVIYNEE